MRLLILSCFSLFVTSIIAQSNAQDPSSDPYSCSPTKPCKIGCCGKSNVCGLGPTFCGNGNCTSSCDAKSECDPGWGAEWSLAEKCPLNVCCSQYGFCGTTEEFCGSKTVKSPGCPSTGGSASQRIVGYYEGWSSTRTCGGLFPEDLSYMLYTHLNYAFAFIDPSSFAIAPMQDLDTELWPRFTALKQLNPGLETWISVGGWSMNDPDQPTHSTFSTLAGDTNAQNAFFKSLINFMTRYGFDGVDIDWEYPVAPERSGNEADFNNYVSFLKNLRNALGSTGHRYGLSITLPSSYWYMRNFDIVKLEPLVDWFNVMTYDLHGTWDSTDPYIGSVVNSHTNLTEIDQTMQLLWRNNIDPKKVTMGMGFYGRSFTLTDPSCTSGGCPFSAGGAPGPCTASAGTLSYAEIEDIIAAGATQREDTASASVIVTWDNNQWVSYDNPTTLGLKMSYANSRCLGGVMVWAASTDDAQGTAISALAGKAGRTELSVAQLARSSKAIDGKCVWSDCSESCPPGTQAITSGSGKSGGFVEIYDVCPNKKKRTFCCPTANAPKCQWRNSGLGHFCRSSCQKGEVAVASDTNVNGFSCWTGHQSLCCTNTATDSNFQACEWRGAAPICATWNAFAIILRNPLLYYNSYDCDKDKPNKLTTGKYGYGGEQPCSELGGFKSMCCSTPNVWQNCAWHGGRNTWTEWANAFYQANPAGLVLNLFSVNPFLQDCTANCPAGQVTVATDATDCLTGTYSFFCCDDPNNPSPPQPSGNAQVCTDPTDLPTSGSHSAEDGLSDGDPNDFFESTYYEDMCGATFDDGMNDNNWNAIGRRSLGVSNLTTIVLFEDEVNTLIRHGILEEINDEFSLVTRQDDPRKGKPMKLCSADTAITLLQLVRYLWPTVLQLATRGQQYISLNTPQGCGRTQLVVGPRQTTQQYDTEHIVPSSQLRNSIQFMIDGRLANGAQLPQGAIPSNVIQAIFGANGGAYNVPWNTLQGNIQPVFGTTPAETAAYQLGTRNTRNTQGNFANLAILERNVNMLRGIITNRQNWTRTPAWNSYNHLQRLARLRNAVLVFDYYRLSIIRNSFAQTMANLNTFWNNFATAVRGTTNYDFAGAFRNIIQADLLQQAIVARNNFNAVINDELAFWGTNAAVVQYGRAVARQNAAALVDLQSTVNTDFSVDVNALLGTPGSGSQSKREAEDGEPVANMTDFLEVVDDLGTRDLVDTPRSRFARDVSYAMKLLKDVVL